MGERPRAARKWTEARPGRHGGSGAEAPAADGRDHRLPASWGAGGAFGAPAESAGVRRRVVRRAPGRLRLRGPRRDRQARPPRRAGPRRRAGPLEADAVQVRLPARDRPELPARAVERRAARVRDAPRATPAQLEEAQNRVGQARRRGQRRAARRPGPRQERPARQGDPDGRQRPLRRQWGRQAALVARRRAAHPQSLELQGAGVRGHRRSQQAARGLRADRLVRGGAGGRGAPPACSPPTS
jgi:hypothetical protein